MHEMITPIHTKIYTLRGKQSMLYFDLAELCHLETQRLNDKKCKEIFKILDTLVFEAKKTDEKVMGF